MGLPPARPPPDHSYVTGAPLPRVPEPHVLCADADRNPSVRRVLQRPGPWDVGVPGEVCFRELARATGVLARLKSGQAAGWKPGSVLSGCKGRFYLAAWRPSCFCSEGV